MSRPLPTLGQRGIVLIPRALALTNAEPVAHCVAVREHES